MSSAAVTPDEFRASEAQLRAILDGVHDHAISLLDPEGRILTWNATAQRLKGYSLAEVRGQHFRLLFTVADQARGLPELELATAAAVGIWRGDGPRLRKDGTTFPARVTLSALRNGDGSLRGFVKVTQDATESLRAEAALKIC